MNKDHVAIVLALVGLGLIVRAAIIDSKWLGLVAIAMVLLAWLIFHTVSWKGKEKPKQSVSTRQDVPPALKRTARFSESFDSNREWDLSAGFVDSPFKQTKR